MSFPDEVTLPHRLWAPPAHSLSSATADSSQLVKGKEGRSEEAEPWSRRCSEAQRSSLRDEAVFSDDPPPWTGAGVGFRFLESLESPQMFTVGISNPISI